MAPSGSKITMLIVVVIAVAVVFIVVYLLQTCRSRFGAGSSEPKEDQAAAPLSPGGIHKNIRVSKLSSVADAVRMSTLNSRNSTNSYDRNHITGASSSTTNGSSLIGYPLNPPPSPATIAGSARYSSNYHPYKHYKIINQPPPPTPCSTDACDESDSNYTSKSARSRDRVMNGNGGGTSSSSGRGGPKYHNHHHHHHHSSANNNSSDRYDSEPYPPPPTPRSHYHSDVGGMREEHYNISCPPSPSSRSSTYFSPLPPPPSPVPSPSRGYS